MNGVRVLQKLCAQGEGNTTRCREVSILKSGPSGLDDPGPSPSIHHPGPTAASAGTALPLCSLFHESELWPPLPHRHRLPAPAPTPFPSGLDGGLPRGAPCLAYMSVVRSCGAACPPASFSSLSICLMNISISRAQLFPLNKQSADFIAGSLFTYLFGALNHS